MVVVVAAVSVGGPASTVDAGDVDYGVQTFVRSSSPPPARLHIRQVQKKLSDEDKQLVQNSMLVGVAPELIGDTADEIRDISTGKGERFIVQGVLRSGLPTREDRLPL